MGQKGSLKRTRKMSPTNLALLKEIITNPADNHRGETLYADEIRRLWQARTGVAASEPTILRGMHQLGLSHKKVRVREDLPRGPHACSIYLAACTCLNLLAPRA